jgi:hypothetical protein
MKPYVALAVLATLLTGCSAEGSLRNTKPTAAYEGRGSVANTAACVEAAWAAKRMHIETHVLYTGTTIEIHQTENSPTVAMVDIKPVSDRTVANYYSSFNEDDSWYFQQVERCVETAQPAE